RPAVAGRPGSSLVEADEYPGGGRVVLGEPVAQVCGSRKESRLRYSSPARLLARSMIAFACRINCLIFPSAPFSWLTRASSPDPKLADSRSWEISRARASRSLVNVVRRFSNAWY